ncbi:DUF397 domain-containing protein [Salinactinospora qingdaonensis]|uniref:DUF397 domain-containing protein n=1 Tax=Salinactinospora qingdaonensis TaxID=702744 RepID=A0ABP7FBW8_9ACTN
MTTQPDLATAHWFKATASNSGHGCVEVAHVAGGTAVRDSKNPDGSVLFFTPHEWECFVDGVGKGEFHRPAR